MPPSTHARPRPGTEAQEIYRGDVTIDVSLEGGSLKAWVGVFGVLLGVYNFVANYKGFKEGVGEAI